MNVLHLSTYPPQECGIATYTQYFVTALRKLGVTSLIAAPEGASGEDVYTGYDPSEPSTRDKLLELVEEEAVDLVHVQHEYGLFGADHGLEAVPLILKLVLNDIPVVTTLHTVYDSLEPEQEIILNSVLKGSDRVVVHEDFQRRTLRNVFSDGITQHLRVIPHGAREIEPVSGARDRLGFDDEEKILLLIGYFRPTKNFEQIVRVFPEILEQAPSSRLVLASQLRNGEYEDYRQKLESMIENSPVRDRITVIDDEIPQERFDTILSASDVVALPYQVISQSGIMAHAFAFGKPMVTSDNIATRNVLEESGAGFVCSNDRDYVNAVSRLFRDDVVYKRFSMNAREYVETAIGWSTIARSYRSLYRDVTGDVDVSGHIDDKTGQTSVLEMVDDNLSV